MSLLARERRFLTFSVVARDNVRSVEEFAYTKSDAASRLGIEPSDTIPPQCDDWVDPGDAPPRAVAARMAADGAAEQAW